MTQHHPALAATPAPLSPEQLQTLDQLLAGSSEAALWWIAGYAAGQAAQRTPAAAPKPANSVVKRLTVAYGSQTGNAKAAAGALAQQAEAQGLAVRLINLADYSLAELGRERFLAIAISTQGDGDPPDDARIFLKQLASARAPKLTELRYTVLALGDSSYAKFCEIGRLLDQRLAELGGQALSPRADADLDIEQAAAPWRASTVDAALDAIGKSAATITQLRPAAAPMIHAASSVQAVVLANQRLTARDSELDVRHVELGFVGPALRYEPGDSLQVRVNNPTVLIDEFLARSGLDGEVKVERGDRRHSLREWLRSERELTRLSLPLLNAIFAAHPEHPL
ncbi:MAG: flavodoxin domain-containing protein, partial [Xanthomonadales bacterium]|nr:flavodoxin domain-containing protein [Xanthomonadales bacterium]